MKVVARRTGDFAHEVEIEGGHTLRIDEPTEIGGTDTGPAPTRLLAASLAGCTAITMELYAERKGWALGAVEVEVDVAYERQAPASFVVTLRLPRDLADSQKERLLGIAAKCPVHRVLSDEIPVTISERVEAL
ncbi:MAG: OsmC family protein [Solirubrobacterales bacterium]